MKETKCKIEQAKPMDAMIVSKGGEVTRSWSLNLSVIVPLQEKLPNIYFHSHQDYGLLKLQGLFACIEYIGINHING